METTVFKALKMLEALCLNDGPSSMTDLARLCGVTKSNAYRLLKTLEECQYISQEPKTKAFRPTLRLWEFGTRVFNQLDLRAAAQPHLKALAAATKESVHLSIFEFGEVIYIDKVDSVHAVRAYIGVGDRAPAYCTATGRATLAFMPQEIIDHVAQNMRRFTPITISTEKRLKAELNDIREKGYAVTLGEWQAGVIGIAAPIRGASGVVVAGIGIAGPEERMRKSNTEKQIAAVLKAAEKISHSLGITAGFPSTDEPDVMAAGGAAKAPKAKSASGRTTAGRTKITAQLSKRRRGKAADAA